VWQLGDRLVVGTPFHFDRGPPKLIDRQCIAVVTRRDAVVADRAKRVPSEVGGNTSEGGWEGQLTWKNSLQTIDFVCGPNRYYQCMIYQ
jgi:hypothetical protein